MGHIPDLSRLSVEGLHNLIRQLFATVQALSAREEQLNETVQALSAREEHFVADLRSSLGRITSVLPVTRPQPSNSYHPHPPNAQPARPAGPPLLGGIPGRLWSGGWGRIDNRAVSGECGGCRDVGQWVSAAFIAASSAASEGAIALLVTACATLSFFSSSALRTHPAIRVNSSSVGAGEKSGNCS